MADLYVPLIGKIDRRSPTDVGNMNDVIWRENYLSRDGRNRRIAGTTRFSDKFSAPVNWSGRYYSDELGVEQPKTFAYSTDGKLWYVDSNTGAITELRDDLNKNAYPRHWIFKEANLFKMFMVDGADLWVHNGNNSNVWDKVKLEDIDGNSVGCIDVIEHKDRLVVVTKDSIHISKNLFPENFTDATDAIEIIVGSGKGDNYALGKIEDNLFIFNAEGIFRLVGDTISAVAETFEVELVEEKSIVSTRSASKVEKAIIFLGQDRELWAFNGVDAEMISYKEKISDLIDPQLFNLEKAVSTYDPFTKYYMLSVTEPGNTYNTLEFFYDTLERKIDFVRGRNVSGYEVIDATREEHFLRFSRSDDNFIMWADRERNFDGVPVVGKITSRDITPKKGENVRFTAFYPEIEPTGNRDLFFRYLLDSRLSEIPSGGVDNCVVNGNFNNWTGGLPDSWSIGGSGGSVTQNTHDSYSGPYSLILTAGAIIPKFVYQAYSGSGLTGKNVKLTAYIKSNSYIGTVMEITTTGGLSVKGVSAIADGNWNRLEVNITLPSSCDSGFWIRFASSASKTVFVDGVVCKIEDTEQANFKIVQDGEYETLGYIRVNNQGQFSDRVLPKINYARGQSIRFEIVDATENMESIVKGIGIDYRYKGKKKGKLIGK